MPCALSQGFTLDCRDSMGGMELAYLIEFDNVSGNIQSGGVVTTITKVTGKRFWKYNQKRETASWEEAYNDNSQNGTSFHTQTLNLVLNKMSGAQSQEVKLLAQNRLMAVVKDRNGKYFLLGEEVGLEREGGKAGSGTAPGDRNGYEITLTSSNRNPAPEVSASIIAGLETPG